MKYNSLILLLGILFCLTTCAQTRRYTSGDYSKEKERISILRAEMAEKYRQADSLAQLQILAESKKILFDLITRDLIPYWYGTKWDYNGTSETPGEGTIACGYFVTTVLRDAGFQLNRYKYAQLASESMILKLTPNVRRFSNAGFEAVRKYIDEVPYGIFIAGLDSHTGFVIKDSAGIRFVHSIAFENVDGVVSQELGEATIFNLSEYKVLGEILHEDMLRNWLEGEKYE